MGRDRLAARRRCLRAAFLGVAGVGRGVGRSGPSRGYAVLAGTRADFDIAYGRASPSHRTRQKTPWVDWLCRRRRRLLDRGRDDWIGGCFLKPANREPVDLVPGSRNFRKVSLICAVSTFPCSHVCGRGSASSERFVRCGEQDGN